MRHQDMQILLVEDDADDVALIRRAFKRGGVDTPLAVLGDGDSAVAYLAGEPPYDDRERHPLPRLCPAVPAWRCWSGPGPAPNPED